MVKINKSSDSRLEIDIDISHLFQVEIDVTNRAYRQMSRSYCDALQEGVKRIQVMSFMYITVY